MEDGTWPSSEPLQEEEGTREKNKNKEGRRERRAHEGKGKEREREREKERPIHPGGRYPDAKR